MGDYVPFATVESGQNSSGFNGFPFRLRSEPASPNSQEILFRMTREELFNFVWRVRKVRIVCSIQWSAGEAPYQKHYSMSGDYIAYLQYGLSSEKNILTSGGYYWFTYFDVPIYNGNSMEGFRQWSISSSNPTEPTPGQIEMGASVRLWAVGIYPATFAGSGPEQVGTMSLFGRPVPLWNSFAYGGTQKVTSVSCTVGIAEYWPYAAPNKILYARPGYNIGDPHPNAGLPIYDTATGATLRDPVTGFDIEL